MKAPNGQPTKLTEQQWLQVRTPEFKAWFGDWENDPKNASKVVDENGEPLVVYHGGTGADISDGFTFDYKFIGRHASAEGYGFYFTSDKNIAQGYQDKGGFLIEGYLNIRKPMPLKQKKFSKNVLKKIIKAVVEKEIEQYPDEITDYRDGFLANYADTYSMSLDRCLNEAANILWENDTALDQVSELANTSGSKEFTLDAVHAVTGYDCFFANGYRDRGGEGGKIYVAWFPEQIKSTQNKGTFDPNNPNILYQDNRNRTGEGRQFHDNTAARQARGFVEIAKGHEYTIQLLQNANLSTLLHETGHIALSEMEHLMEMGLADDKLRADYQKIREYLGLKEGDNLSNLSDPRMVQANEKFAKAMELYLREGKAPSANLEGAFSRFKRWLMRIYKSVTDNPYFKGVTLNEDIRGVFDRLLANDAEIRRAAEKGLEPPADFVDKGRGMVEGQKSRLHSIGCRLFLKVLQSRSCPTATGVLSSPTRLIHDRT
ncbi:hypothetical protein [uncultured Mailhella sp.]|uniref:ADP-ribosyltransferase-containing protein n=1 Tax=uncultured Mailhella sp. TaxID=1981031 RepID=UPI0026240A4F|nr:hypothetical protein [uncultured Mailhella sp.]